MKDIRMGAAIVMLYENYTKAKESKFVLKPISYALYQTWEYFDKHEKKRRIDSSNT